MQYQSDPTISGKCLKEDCKGTLRQWPFIMLSYPPIYPYECRLCKQRYRAKAFERLTFSDGERAFDWGEVVDIILPLLDRNKLNAD